MNTENEFNVSKESYIVAKTIKAKSLKKKQTSIVKFKGSSFRITFHGKHGQIEDCYQPFSDAQALSVTEWTRHHKARYELEVLIGALCVVTGEAVWTLKFNQPGEMDVVVLAHNIKMYVIKSTIITVGFVSVYLAACYALSDKD